MRKKIVLFTALFTLVVFAAITGCKRGDDNYNTYNDITFWNNENTVTGTITVTVDGVASDYITAQKEAFNCNVSGCANFNVSSGTHNFVATSNDGWYWSGSFVSNNACNTYELHTLDGDHDRMVTFWNDDNTVGDITVTVDGLVSSTITLAKNPSNCNSNGCANFGVTPGFHTYTAHATTGQNWSGNLTSTGSCLLFELF